MSNPDGGSHSLAGMQAGFLSQPLQSGGVPTVTPDPTETLTKEEQRGVGPQRAILSAAGLWKIPGPEGECWVCQAMEESGPFS